MPPLLASILIGLTASVVVVILSRAAATRRAEQIIESADVAVTAALRSGDIESAAIRRSHETAARKHVLELRAQADDAFSRQLERLSRHEQRLAGLDAELAEEQSSLQNRADALDERHKNIRSLKDRAQGLRRDAAKRRAQADALLEEKAGESAEDIQQSMARRWLEDARAEAGQTLRVVEQMVASPAHEREARRLLDIASSRYQNHFLTERNLSNLRVGADICELLTQNGGALHDTLQTVSNVQLQVNAEGDAIRLDGLDGVGREIARRALNRLLKRPRSRNEALENPLPWATKFRDNIEREILSLGKKAFNVLRIPKAHPEIVHLVGALNFRTSYTQNQWLHAVEASFLAGMMASEMGLDIKLARRATLVHDIGKALTHKIEGSHAVIGADIARRLGEDELVANAIGAHHADEPFNSVYAYLVAAADAMSGARPGARREPTDGFSARVEDLERIGEAYKGVERAHAVHGGRELRVYVNETHVSDLDVIELSSEIAAQIADEMTFPGQIKVTVIRAYEAVAVAS